MARMDEEKYAQQCNLRVLAYVKSPYLYSPNIIHKKSVSEKKKKLLTLLMTDPPNGNRARHVIWHKLYTYKILGKEFYLPK